MREACDVQVAVGAGTDVGRASEPLGQYYLVNGISLVGHAVLQLRRRKREPVPVLVEVQRVDASVVAVADEHRAVIRVRLGKLCKANPGGRHGAVPREFGVLILISRIADHARQPLLCSRPHGRLPPAVEPVPHHVDLVGVVVAVLGDPHYAGGRVKRHSEAVPYSHRVVGAGRIHPEYHAGVHVVCGARRVDVRQVLVLQRPVLAGVAYYRIHLAVGTGGHGPAVVVRVGRKIRYNHRIYEGLPVPRVPLNPVGYGVAVRIGDRIVEVYGIPGSGYSEEPHLPLRRGLDRCDRFGHELPVADQPHVAVPLQNQQVAVPHELHARGAAAEPRDVDLQRERVVVQYRFGGRHVGGRQHRQRGGGRHKYGRKHTPRNRRTVLFLY